MQINYLFMRRLIQTQSLCIRRQLKKMSSCLSGICVVQTEFHSSKIGFSVSESFSGTLSFLWHCRKFYKSLLKHSTFNQINRSTTTFIFNNEIPLKILLRCPSNTFPRCTSKLWQHRQSYYYKWLVRFSFRWLKFCREHGFFIHFWSCSKRKGN